ncbi:MAG: hypothetical protein JW384_01958 [Nitrosomonadaceae bacterium]|nr:hypothetical protein [Nitrosomonadaceae bacterium]
MSSEDVSIIEAMLKYGGGFANALAKAAIRSDEDNLRRIKGCWPELWEEYRMMVAARSKVKEVV